MTRAIRPGRQYFGLAGGLAFALALAAGGCRNSQEPEASPTPSASPAEAPRSIFQPEYRDQETAALDPVVPEPLEETIGFPDGGDELDADAKAAIAAVLRSPQMAEGWPIMLRGHSDAGGSDAANLRVSQGRAEAVRDALVEGGIAEERITVIAFGEQNPVRPNALPNGEPSEEGRAANRRVDIVIDSPEDIIPSSPEREPTIIESIATPSAGPSPLTSPTPVQGRQRGTIGS